MPSPSTGIVSSLPAAQAGIGSGINSAVREVGAALGVATIGSTLASRFAHLVPVKIQGQGSVLETLRTARALGPATHHEAITAFTNAMALGLRAISLVVLLGAVFTAVDLRADVPQRTAIGVGQRP